MRLKDLLFTVMTAIFLVALGVLAFNIYATTRRVTIEAGQVVQPTALPPAPTIAALVPTSQADPGAVPTIGPAPTPTPYTPPRDPSRVNILLLGVDERNIEEGPWRTDTMILISLDPVRQTISMLSIPRDLWVNIPGYRAARINQANFYGDGNNYPGGGPVLAMRTVEATIGVPVDHYIMVNFEVFLELVDTLIAALPGGGIEICVEETIHDERYPVPGSFAYMTVHFDPGCQLMSSEQLLQYARTRHGGSDFDRAERQQQIIRAIRDEALSIGGMQALIGQAQSVWEAIRDGIRTDMSFDQLISLAFAAQDAGQIRSAVIDENYVTLEETLDKQQILLPDRTSIRALGQMLFAPPLSTDDLARLAAQREAGLSILVLNGTTVQGLAAGAAEKLDEGGLANDGIMSAQQNDYEQSIIFVRTGGWYTAWYIADLLGLPRETARPGWGGIPGDWDVLIILGADYAEQPPELLAPPAQ